MTDQDPFSFTRSPALPEGAKLYIARRAGPEQNSEPLAALGNIYLDRRRKFDTCETTDQENDEYCVSQEELLDRMEATPAVLLDDIVAKLLVIREELWDEAGGDENQYSPADRLVLTLADDLRRVLGATTAYRLEPRLWVESAICAGMDPTAMIYLLPSDDIRQPGHVVGSWRLCQRVAGLNPRYEPPRLSPEETSAVIDELIRLGRADYYTVPPARAEVLGAEERS